MSIKHALLSLVADSPCGVGRLRKRFADYTGGTWPLNVGQIYQTMQRLERDGLVELIGAEADPESGRNADIYSITAAGVKELDCWWSTPTLKARTDRDELVIKISMAALNAHIDMSDLIQLQRQAVMIDLARITREKAKTEATQTAHRMLLEKQIFDLEAVARWLDHIETLPRPAVPVEAAHKRRENPKDSISSLLIDDSHSNTSTPSRSDISSEGSVQ